ISWGAISLCMVFVRGEYSFYGLRMLLGVAEAGLYPGVVFFLTTWFPSKYRARIFGFFSLAIPLSTFTGAALSGLILGLDGVLGLRGWMRLFILESVRTLLLAFVVLRVLVDRPAEAKWLTAEERDFLINRLAQERSADGLSHTALSALKN